MNRLIIFSRNGVGALLLCMLGVSFSAQTQAGGFTAVEIAGTPQYCQDFFSGDRNRMERWKRELPGDIRHFCNGLIYFLRASAEIDANRRRTNTSQAIDNFNYGLQRWPANHPLYQQAQMYKQQLEMMSKWK